jgi:cation diffusion facilitator family transporter
MALVEGTAGWVADSTGLLADGLDMLSDAMAYAIALAATGRSLRFKTHAARVSGAVLLVLGVGVLVEAGRRAIYGSEPASAVMVAVAVMALMVNVSVLRLLHPFRAGEIHLRATWMFTRADVVANLGVIVSSALVYITGSHYPDIVVGGAIGAYVVHEAVEILREASGE